jgi:hypothetical protein
MSTLYTRAEGLSFLEAGQIPPDGIRLFNRGYIDGTGQLFRRVHRKKDCLGRHCPIHNPSDHSMREFPTHLRVPSPVDIKPMHMERICPHRIGHPDPDDINYWDVSVHGCDGCCRETIAKFLATETLQPDLGT